MKELSHGEGGVSAGAWSSKQETESQRIHSRVLVIASAWLHEVDSFAAIPYCTCGAPRCNIDMIQEGERLEFNTGREEH